MVESYFSCAFSFIITRLCVKVHTSWVETVRFSAAEKVTRRWQRRWPAFGLTDAEPLRDAGYLNTVLTSSASGKTVNIEYRSWPQQTRSDLCKLAKKKTDGGTQMPKQKQRGGFFFFFFFLSTLGTSGYSHSFSHWARLWRSLAPSDVKPYKQISEHGHIWLHSLSCEGGGVLICSLHCINRHCPHTAVRNPCKTTHTFNTPQIHRNTRSKRLFQTIKLSFLRRK